MQRDAARLLHPGVRPSQVQRRAPAVVLLLLFLIPIVQPVTTAEVATDDFGILDALDELLEDISPCCQGFGSCVCVLYVCVFVCVCRGV